MYLISMWLIDASQIHIGGAVSILEMVLEELNVQQIDFVLLKDKRLEDSRFFPVNFLETKRGIISRKRNYKQILNQYPISKVISLISIPPPIKLDVPVHTYFHNVNLLRSANIANASLKYRIGQRLKNVYIKSKLKNTDYYAFQSELIQSDFLSEFPFPADKCFVFPFFKEKAIDAVRLKQIPKVADSFIYISVDYPHKNHRRLLAAWQMLAELGYTPKLTISIPKANHELNQTITNLNTQGCNILNLGIADYQTVLEQTAASSYCVFPSMSESLGLGIIESQKLGNKVLASNLPYVYQAVQPTAVFDPTSVESIVDCVVIALTKETPPTELRMQNQLKDWIAFVQMLD